MRSTYPNGSSVQREGSVGDYYSGRNAGVEVPGPAHDVTPLEGANARLAAQVSRLEGLNDRLRGGVERIGGPLPFPSSNAAATHGPTGAVPLPGLTDQLHLSLQELEQRVESLADLVAVVCRL